jgi:hypothetical protein
MKKYFILPVFIFISCTNTGSLFRFQQANPVGLGKICIDKNFCVYFNADSDLDYLFMVDSDKSVVDSVEYSPYKSTLYSFKSQEDSAYIVFGETEYEYFPVLKAYYVIGSRIVKIGELKISLPCQDCESFEYPVNKIQIQRHKNIVEFFFLEDVNFRNDDSEDWTFCKAGSLKYFYNTMDESVRLEF